MTFSSSMRTVCVAIVALLVFSWTTLDAQIPVQDQPINERVVRPFGQPVIPIYDGWYENADGSRYLCFSYFNLNMEEDLDIPLGSDNLIEPSQFDGMQPTHFRRIPEGNYRRDYCVFTILVPEDFDGTDRVIWTLRNRGGTFSSPGHVMPSYVLDEPDSEGRSIAPYLTLDPGGPSVRGRNGLMTGPLSGKVGEPVPLTVSVDHPEIQRNWLLVWALHQGPGAVLFSETELRVGQADGEATVTATFSEVGEYILRVQAIEGVSTFEFHCCWTNGYVTVTVEE